MRLIDNSFYNPSIAVENAIIEITVPGGSCPVAFYTQANFNTVFNSSTLGLLPTTTYNGLVNLPDGVYRIKYSIKPNNLIHEEFDHLRNCQQLQMYYQAVCDLFAQKCDLGKKEFNERLKSLEWIKQLIDAAKSMVEVCDNSVEGLELYDEAKHLLNNLC